MFDTNEIWDITSTLIPPRSHLYHLEPIGIGTSYVESLTSYITRLALSHNVTTGALLTLEVASLAKKNYNSELKKRFEKLFGDPKHLNGMDPEVIRLVEAVESLTLRDNLSFLTLLPWSKLLDRKGFLRKNKAWCPYCYAEWRTSKLTIYDPLLWFLSAVKSCPSHHQLLHERCPQCNQLNRILSIKSVPGYCSHCKQWLGISERIDTTAIFKIMDNELKYEEWVLENLGMLVSMPTFSIDMPSEKWISEVFSEYAKSAGSLNKLAHFLEMNQETVRQWSTGKCLMTINSLLLVCRSLEISFSEFLNRPTSVVLSRLAERQELQQCQRHSFPRKALNTWSQKQSILQEALDEYPPPSVQELAKRHGYAHEGALRRLKTLDLWNAVIIRHKDYQKDQRLKEQRFALKNAFESKKYPSLPMKRVAKQIGSTVQTLYKNFPELCRAISKRYNTYREMEAIRNRLRSRQQVWLIASEIHKDGVKPTDGRISTRLTNRVMINRKDILLATKEARRRLNCE